MKKFTKLVCLLLVMTMVLGLAACKKNVVDPYANMDYDVASEEIYDEVLGGYESFYAQAKEAESLSERWALMAIAEAKMLGSGIMLPLSSNGGTYGISRVAPYTATSVLWGNDSYRYHDVLVTTELIKAEHRDALKAKWAELKGTGTWEAEAEKYLLANGYTLKDTYTIGYSSDPQTWDVLATSMAADSEAIVNTYDGLYEYDNENVLQPALAESYEKTVNEDGTVNYTFKIKTGLKWVDSQGREVADVKADDFVAGMQHMMDAMGGLEYLVDGLIVNAHEYIFREITDFAQVGVKATDDTTLVYTLTNDAPYFMTMLGYGVFAPMSRAYYTSQGGKFGAEYDDAAANYTYGKTPDNIAYCGPYVVTNATAENTIVFQANAAYWDAANINIKTLTWMYNDGEDALKGYNDAIAGTIDGSGLNPSSLEKCKTDGNFEPYSYVSSCDATSFMAFYNLHRVATSNFTGDGACPTSKTADDIVRSNIAMLNADFRLALSMATDRASYNAQTVGEELKLTSLRNSYTPGTFVSLEEETTVSINGTDKTYPAGTFYGQIMQDQIDADGIEITVWDPTAEGGIGSTDGFDGWYNPEAAASRLEKAIEALKAEGLEISAENPIYLDLPCWTTNESYANRAQVYKQSIEENLGGKVIINLTVCETVMDWYNAGYYPTTGAEGNYDICDLSGWGPDYGDPQTYLDTMLPDYAGYMTKAIGVF
ncbi:MAG: peptide ABC transporter substrate-binding protein [Oscillospiraceae bacterium]|nr:peptide ABC transporter substrate-binding protein [Oscillospiraceae bacterium]